MSKNAQSFLPWILRLLVVLLLPSIVLVAQSADKASVPKDSPIRLVSYSGKVSDRASAATDSACEITFAVYRDETGGAPLWLETQNVTLDQGGHYSVLLGSTTSGLPIDLFPSDEQRWLGVQVQGQPEQPRVLLTSVPYSIRAVEADTLAGHAASEFVTTDNLQSVVHQQLQQQTAAAPSATTAIANGQTRQAGTLPATTDSATNFVDSNADQVVSVLQNGSGMALSASALNNSAIVGTANARVPSNVTAGVVGVSSLDGSFGIYGHATSGSSTSPGVGVYGQSDSPNGIALIGIARGTGNTIGVIGQASSSSGFAINATETATSGNTVGLAAQIYSPTGIGALIMNNASGSVTGSLISARTNAGVRFSVDGGGNVNAQGRVNALGTVSGSQLISTVANGSAPLQVASTALVPNLNASLLGGMAANAFAPASSSTNYIQNGVVRQSGTNFNIDGNGTLGGTLAASSVNATALQVAGAVNISGIGHGLTFPDGTTQTTASNVTLNSNVFTGNQEAPNFVADTQMTIGTNPSLSGQAAIIPDNLDTVHQYWGQAGQNMHFRLSSAVPGPGGSKNLIIAPYLYGMALEYAGVFEAWVDDFSVHTNQQYQGQGVPARFWVGDENDLGGLFVTAMNNGGGPNSYVTLAADRFTHQSHGTMQFQVRDQEDGYKFQWGPRGSELTRASFTNTATATNLNLMYGSVQGTVTADSNNNGAINVGSVSATPVNFVTGGTPQVTVYADGNVSIGNSQDTIRLSVGPTSLFTVDDQGVVTATALNLTSSLNTGNLSAKSLQTGSLNLSGTLTASSINSSGTIKSTAIETGALTASAISSDSLVTPTLNAGSVTSTSIIINSLNATTATAATVNSNTINTNSLRLGGGTAVLGHLSVASMVDFASIPANTCLARSVRVVGAADGDTVALGIPSILGAVDGLTWFGWVSGADTVSIRGCNATLTASADPPAATIRVDVWKH